MVLALSLSFQRPSSVFEQTRLKDSNKDYNLIIKQQAKLKNDHAILSTHTQMESLDVLPDSTTLPLVLKACARLNAVDRGKRIHDCVARTDLINDVRVGTSLVDFYCKCGFLEDAVNVFGEMRERDLVSWNAMLNGYVGCGCYEEAISLVTRMQKEGLRPNSHTVVALLSACGEVSNLRLGKEIHGFCLRNGLFESGPHVGTALIGFYLDHDVRVSRLVFDMMAVKNVVSWNSMISGYFDIGECFNALKVFLRMVMDGVDFDSVTILVVIQACAQLGSLKLAMQIHAIAVKKYRNSLFIANALLNMYSEIGNLEISRELFDTIPSYDVPLWNSMISTYVEYGYYEEATSLFIQMRKEGIREDKRTIVILLSLCEKLADCLKEGKSLHALASKNKMKLDAPLGNALLGMYAKQNCVESVKKVFSEMSHVDVVSYNTLILAMARNNFRAEALELFTTMRESVVKPNSYTIISILASCEDETCLNIGRSLHGFVIKYGIEINQSLNSALTDMYMSCGDEATARNLFDGYLNRDLISWNALIASYIKNNYANKALLVFSQMISEVEPNSVTFINILSSCTHLANLPQGQCLHAYATRKGSSFGFDLSLANAFMSMYARCGSMKNAEKIFESLPRKNIISWNAIITSYGMHGCGYDAIRAFLRMLEDDLRPNGVTFISLLSACSHSGLIEEGLQIFHSMIQDFNITPELAHYGCVVDLLGRGGFLNEAKDFIKLMPIEPDASVWRALLSASRLHANIKEAKSIFEKLVELEPTNAGNYVLISNIYAAAGLRSEVRQIRTWLREKDLKKPPGISWIAVRSQVHSFMAGSKSHPQTDEIYENLTSLLSSMKDLGYAPDFHWVLHYEED
ncbi:hypothetical protein LWI29_023178 [Acer saccharum]|uniref:Pentatricopeptide repeat-containing protein n=1 Tax=Acer saccharum TaxID=4024 RepID=A0AA39W639_ACESA|nr:hypothetical protein LWI29_023178 [Acer saccharum]